ncbi:2OG-Fe(II) oxygenase family protein [Microbacterium enclense]|uniref:2OG-Fe(II) oxygenase family protein n=1 Tax=Microbacterium enclense TaxID=993073 RepID=UPI0036DC6E27
MKGLQVLGQDGSWNDVSPADGALLVNLGDVAARLTNDKWMSTLHRVKPPVIDGTIERRRSAAFFHDGNADAVIAPLPHFVSSEAPALYEPVTVSEHIAAKLGGSRAGRRNDTAVREAARVMASLG